MKISIVLFALAAACSWLLTPLVARLGHHLRAYGSRRDKRRSALVPRLGGVAIFAAVLAAWAILLAASGSASSWLPFNGQALGALLVPAALVLFLGAYDDLRGTRPWQKLLVETAAAAIAWAAGSRILSVPLLGGPIHSDALSFLLTVIWVVAVTNAFNLIDGLDGLAAGVAFLVAVSLFLVSRIEGSGLTAALAITLAGALVGFLRFNFAPAKIFLGDAGSLTLGFLLALLAARTSLKSSTLVTIAVPYVAFGLPLFDTSLAVVRRFLSGHPVFAPDCDHIHHRLLAGKFTHRSSVLILYALAALFCLGSLLILRSTGSLFVLGAVLAAATAWFLCRQLRYEELAELGAYLSRAVRAQRRILANQIRIRKVSKQLDGAPSLEACWKLLVETLAAMDFDEISFRLTGRRARPLPFLPPWRRSGKEPFENAWTVLIPLGTGEKDLGELRLRRAIPGDRLLFQFSSLLETLLPPFERQLTRRYQSQESVSRPQYLLPGIARPPEPAVLVNQRGKA